MPLSRKLDLSIFVKKMYGITIMVSVLVVILAMSYLVSRISSPDKIVALDGEWRISFEDASYYSNTEFDDSNWGLITLPGSFINDSIKTANKVAGVCWLRKSFKMNSNVDKAGLILGRIANADETYVNGKRIGSTGAFPPNEFAMWNYTRSYVLPDNLLRNDSENVVAIRVSYNQIGEVLGYMSITGMEDCINYGTAVNFFQITMGYIAIGIGLSLFVIISVFYYKKSDIEEYFYYALQLIAGLPVVLETCIGLNIYPDQAFRSKLLLLSWVFLNVAHPIFLHRIYNLKRVMIEKVLWSYFTFVLLGCLIITDESTFRFHGTNLITITCFIGLYNLSCHISALIKKRPYARIFSLFGMVAVICAIHDGYLYLIKYFVFEIELMTPAYSVMVFHIGVFFLYFGTSLVLVSRFIDIATEIDDLNSNLENYIIKNSFLSEKLKQTIINNNAIPLKAEKKIKEVISIINEKYFSELDRVVLAKSVGVHPDNLSKQFKKYTGKKLSDYIYELRINEASKRLRETDDKIIDIAFSVGFESLRTFNRVFPKIMRMTPINYRRQHR